MVEVRESWDPINRGWMINRSKQPKQVWADLHQAVAQWGGNRWKIKRS
jgi:hypothetical protein